jgi:DNA-binding response OmpR family regulator
MYRQRGRTIGTFVIGALVVVAVIYAAFGRLGSSTMPAPHVRAQHGAAETSQQSKPGHDLAINPTTEECRKGWEAAVKLTKKQFELLCTQTQAAR